MLELLLMNYKISRNKSINIWWNKLHPDEQRKRKSCSLGQGMCNRISLPNRVRERETPKEGNVDQSIFY